MKTDEQIDEHIFGLYHNPKYKPGNFEILFPLFIFLGFISGGVIGFVVSNGDSVTSLIGMMIGVTIFFLIHYFISLISRSKQNKIYLKEKMKYMEKGK